MQENYVDRVLKCADCNADFVFTAGEQLFFFDKQFKNDPKRCKPCKSRRSGLAAVANGQSLPKSAMLRTETRTQCSECGIETTVPFRPTQGRPVLCRQCFARKSPVTPTMPAGMDAPAEQAMVLAELSLESSGMMLSHDAAVAAVASMAAGHGGESSVASEADLAAVAGLEAEVAGEELTLEMIAQMPVEARENVSPESLMALAAENPQA